MHDCIGDGGGYFASFGGSPVLNNYSFRALLHFNCTAPANVGSFALGCPNDNTQIIDCISINAAKTCVNLFTGVDHTNLQILHCTLWGYGSRGISVGSTSDRMSGLVKNTIAWSPAAISNHVRFQDGVPAQALVSDYNLFGPDLVACIQYNTVNYNSMAAYQTATGQDAHSSTNDPMLADPSTRTPRAGESMDAFIARAMKAADLDPSSWAIGRGVLIPGVNDSFYGPAPDIGAREWQHQVLN
jgi:hypothetical protein